MSVVPLNSDIGCRVLFSDGTQGLKHVDFYEPDGLKETSIGSIDIPPERIEANETVEQLKPNSYFKGVVITGMDLTDNEMDVTFSTREN